MGLFNFFGKKKETDEDKEKIKEIVVDEMVKMEIKIAQDSQINNWTKEEESRIFKERIKKNNIIQLYGSNFTKEELENVLLPEVKKRIGS